MKILVLNCGSSSLKFQLIETVGERVLAHGRVERIGEQDAGIQFAAAGGSEKRETRRVEDHSAAIASAFDFLKEEANLTGGL